MLSVSCNFVSYLCQKYISSHRFPIFLVVIFITFYKWKLLSYNQELDITAFGWKIIIHSFLPTPRIFQNGHLSHLIYLHGWMTKFNGYFAK